MQDVEQKLKDLSILIVDDEEFILETMAHFLKRRAKNVDTATDGQKALELFESKRHDVVVSDIEMPELNGYELYDAVSKIDKKTVFIFLSGHDSHEIDEAFLEQTLYKPIDKDRLIEKIITLVRPGG